MEHNSLAMETLILCYIESKNLLRTKQLDQGGFNKLLIKSCEGLNYSEEEILSTWRNLVRQYLQVKNNSLEKESWKYFKIMDSCYEVSDFHQCGQSKFSDEMVWFLIECLLKRRDNRKRTQNLERMIEVYHKFLEEGYEILLLHDIQTKWRYLNYRYSKLEGIKDAPLKMSYFTAMDEFRKGKHCVKIHFTKSLTEILIRKFTEKKVMCNFHGYDSPQLLSEIQSEFENLESNAGFNFSCKEIKDKWDKLTYVYEFLKKKHKNESQWMYFQAMREHFEDNVIETGVKPLNNTENVFKKRSKSLNKIKKSKPTVVDQFDERSMSPFNTEKGEQFESFDSIASITTQKVGNKNNKKISDVNSDIKPLDTTATENVLKKRSKSVGELNKNKKSKLTVIDLVDKRSISPLNVERVEKCESSFDSLASIKSQKVENKKNKKISHENSEVKPLNTTENVLKKRSKSPNKYKNSKLAVVNQFDERSMSSFITEIEKFESFDSIDSIKTQKVGNKNNQKISDENSVIKPLNTTVTENVLKKRSKSVGETNKNKKSKLTVIDLFDKRSISPLNVKTVENFESSFDSIASINIHKVKNQKNQKMSDDNISNVSENPPKSNNTSKKKQIFQIKEPKHNYNGDISCAPNDHLKVTKPFRTKKIGKSSNKNISSSPQKNQKVVEYPKTKKSLKVDQMKDNCTSDFPTISLENHKPYVNDLADNMQYVEQIHSAELLTSQKSEIHLNNNESNMDESSGNMNINLPSFTKECSSNECIPHPDVNENVEEENSSKSFTSQKSEVHLNNNEPNIDKDSCNITINLPSITKKFSGNEFLPLKKRLRLNEDKISLTNEIKDGFRGFSVMDQMHAQFCAQAKDFNQLSKEETPAEVMTDMPMAEDMTDIPGTEDTNNINYTTEQNNEPVENVVSHSFRSLNNLSPPSVMSPERDHHPLPEQDFHTNGLSPQPVLLFVNEVDEINSSVEGELNNRLSIEKDEEIKGESNSDGVDDGNESHHTAVHICEDTSLNECVSTELIETSIVDETISEMEIRSSEYYQKPEIPIQHSSSEYVEPEVLIENVIFVEENTIPTMELSNETLDTSVEYATVDTDYKSSDNNMEYPIKFCEITIVNLETQQCQTELHNDVEQTKCNSTSISPDTLGDNEVANFQHYQTLNLSPPSQCNLNQTDAMDTVENVFTEMKSVRLPVTCGGKLKEIFISPRELSKISKMKPNSVKPLKNPPMVLNEKKYISKNNCKNIKFMSHVIKEADVKNHNLTNGEANETLNNSNIFPPVQKYPSSAGILNRNQQSPICPDREFDGISIVSSVIDDEHLSDDLLADVIDDFQAQSSQELKDIKNLVRENNLMQRETNRILRQILEKL